MKRRGNSTTIVWPLTHALGWIVVSMWIVAIGGHLSLKWYSGYKLKLAQSPEYAISTLVQTGPQKEALKTEYLAELLNLSMDRSPSSLTFNVKAAEQRLLASPLIARAVVKMIKPHTVYVDYQIRQPVAWLYDYYNVAIDKEGYPIPFTPFFSPKNLPEIYCGLAPFGTFSEDREKPVALFGRPLTGKYVELAFHLLHLLESLHVRDLFHVRRIDVSNAFRESYGTREIVIIAEDTIVCQQGEKEYHIIFPKMLRLSTKNYSQELGNYLKLRASLIEKEAQEAQKIPLDPLVQCMRKKEKIIDFRIENLAFIDEQTH